MPNTLKELPKTIKIEPKWRNFVESGHTSYSPCCKAFTAAQLKQFILPNKIDLNFTSRTAPSMNANFS